jgi:hypothetical protein
MRYQATKFINIATVIKVAIAGLLVAESWYFSKAFRAPLVRAITDAHYENVAFLICAIGLVLVALYAVSRDFVSFTGLLFKSHRVDVYFAFSLGIGIAIYFGGVWTTQYSRFAALFSPHQLWAVVLIPLATSIVILIGTRTDTLFRRKRSEDDFFLSDLELRSPQDDLLGIADEAARFAERVINLGSSKSIAFGIDAPWGIGKSTFVNFCSKYWESNHRHSVVVYDFNPLKYEGRPNLLELFVDGLIRVIQKHAYLPEARPLFNRYARFIKGAKAGLFGLDLELLWGTGTIDDALEDLESILSTFDRKLIIVVDDLDRLSFAAVKEVLFAIKKSFTLPNITYVLSYDTQNIGSVEEYQPDAEKVNEFLEKFVNVKVSLYLDSSTLARYVTDNLKIALSGNSQADPGLIAKAVGGLINIYKSPNYFDYHALVGDIRKIKRLINTLLLLQIEKTDFDNTDFNQDDLIRLILIYMNFPNVFRDIYISETEGRMGSFSVLGPYDPNYPSDPPSTRSTRTDCYKNSARYDEYVKDLGPQKRILLDSVFGANNRLGGQLISSISEEAKHSFACFNGGVGTGVNLRQYLQLIVKLSKPQDTTQYRFYLNCKRRVERGESIETILAAPAFDPSNGEQTHAQFWKVIVNSAGDFNALAAVKVITYLLHNIAHYSLLEVTPSGIGLRDDLPLYLVKLVDTAGWTGANDSRTPNSDENIFEITEWIFGEGDHAGIGVIETLARQDRGIAGFFDLLVFRLYCSADRGGNFFNLQRALSKRGDPDAPTSGLTSTIAIGEMREMSQHVFRQFSERYIRQRVSVFEAVDALTVVDYTGWFLAYVNRQISDGFLTDIDAHVGRLRTKLKVFIVYQLGSTAVNMGVGCGYYDISGNLDRHEIAREMNSYLFEVCFTTVDRMVGYRHFLDYLLMNFVSTFGSDGQRDYVAAIGEFTKVLDTARLKSYWAENGASIRAAHFELEERTVFGGNYTASYSSDLEEVYQILDDQVAQGFSSSAESAE